MVKDSKKYTATGGWGFAHFKDGKPGDEAFMKTCFPCHNQAKASDLVFTRYAPKILRTTAVRNATMTAHKSTWLALLCGVVAIAAATADEGRMPDLEGAVAWLNPLR